MSSSCVPNFIVIKPESVNNLMAPFGSPASRVVSPTALTGRPVSSAEPPEAAFRACGWGSDGGQQGQPLQRACARAFTGHKRTWPLRTPALRSGVCLPIFGCGGHVAVTSTRGRIQAPPFIRDKGEVHACGALVSAVCRCFSALCREELTET